ncbi:hypothetical protein [Amycolatopsis sp. RTGN1]|uniref:hypothetical protein n=1 Tax=Amycolatopsis ponsaeliensis TaxID=2992142 RepID=UPI002550F70F|nr:hypothetical protein [Amycolatopsis sp. RTGN1]
MSLVGRRQLGGRWRVRPAVRNRWLLFAVVTVAVVPADDGGDLWAMAAVFGLVGASVLVYRALVRAAAKVEAALDDELDFRAQPRTGFVPSKRIGSE